MADRQTGIEAVFTANLESLRKDYDAFRQEVASRPIRVAFEGDRTAGGAAAGSTSPVGTFSGGGPSYESVGPTAGQRLDAMNYARTAGASLVMQNGLPGATPGGIAIAADRLDARSNYGTASPSAIDNLYNLARAQGANGPRAFPQMPALPLYDAMWQNAPREEGPSGGRYGSFGYTGETVDVGRRRSQPAYDLVHRQQRALPYNGPAADPDVIDVEWEPTRERPRRPYTEVGPEQAERRPDGFFRPNRYNYIAGGITAAAFAGRTLANEENYQSSLTQARGNQRALADAEIGRVESYIGGFDPFGLPLGSGIAAVTGVTRGLGQVRASLASSDAANAYASDRRAFALQSNASIGRSRAEGVGYGVGGYAGGLAGVDAEVAALRAQRTAEMSIDDNPLLKSQNDRLIAARSAYGVGELRGGYFATKDGEKVGGTYFTREEAGAASQGRSNQEVGEIGRRIAELRSEIAKPIDAAIGALGDRRAAIVRQRTGIIASEQSGLRAAEFDVSRNAIGSLYENTVGQGIASAFAGAPEDALRTVANAGRSFATAGRQIIRDNREASYGIRQGTLAARQRREGFTHAGAVTDIDTEETEALRRIPKTGNDFADAFFGFTDRRRAVSGLANERRAGAGANETRAQLESDARLQTNRLLLSDRPLDAQIQSINNAADSAAYGLSARSPELARIRREQFSNVARTQQEDRYERKLIGIGQYYSGLSLSRRMSDDPYAAYSSELDDIAGGGLQEANQLARRFGPGSRESEEARRQTIQRLDLSARDVARGFRAESISQNEAFFGSRDTFDFSAYGADLAARRSEVAGATLGSEGGDVTIQGLKGALTEFAIELAGKLMLR